MRAAFTVLRAGRIATTSLRPVIARPVLPAFAFSPSTSSFSTTSPVLKKADKKKAKEDKKDDKKDDKKGKGKNKKAEDEDSGLSPEEITKIVDKVTSRMDRSAEWARTTVFDGVERGRGRVLPSVLDPVKVSMPDQGLVPLKTVASITVKNQTLIVDVWDADSVKHVESAIHSANLPGISPQREGNSLRIPVARPTSDTRTAILRSLQETIESAKAQIRIARTDALKALGGRGEEGTDDVQKATDAHSSEMDKLLVNAKKELEK